MGGVRGSKAGREYADWTIHDFLKVGIIGYGAWQLFKPAGWSAVWTFQPAVNKRPWN